MSLSSVELNYLIWRYLKEEGIELAAYALQKETSCLDYEHESNDFVAQIEPGCLVSLVQKGIFYTFLEDASEGKAPRLSLPDAVMREKQELKSAKDQGDLTGRVMASDLDKCGSAPGPGQDAQGPGQDASGPGQDAQGPGQDASGPGQDASGPGEAGSAPAKQNVSAGANDGRPDEQHDFTTVQLAASETLPASLCSQWHPGSEVVAVGNDDSSAAIHALQNGKVTETVKLSHPPVVQMASTMPNAITCVAWSPQGTMVLTASENGELRAWTPDGRLKNVVNGAAETATVSAPVAELLWNSRGSLVLAVDVANKVSIYEAVALAMVSEMRGLEPRPTTEPDGRSGPEPEVHACWISDHKFAVTTTKNHIQIFAVNAGEGLVGAGQLAGHEHAISSLTFSPVSKLLASASDVDYAIRVWNSQSSHDALELNVRADNLPNVEYHAAPILELTWLSRSAEVEGNLLLSVSMEGVVNLWDAFTGDVLASLNIFKNPDNFRYSKKVLGGSTEPVSAESVSTESVSAESVSAESVSAESVSAESVSAESVSAESSDERGSSKKESFYTKNALIYAAAVSPAADHLAIGDDSGGVSIWGIQHVHQRHGVLPCLGVFQPSHCSDAFGICDLSWSTSGEYLIVNYKGRDSVIINWTREAPTAAS